MKRRAATPDERDSCVNLYRKVMMTMHGTEIDEVLTTLCFIVAEIGVELDHMSKEEFIANVMQQVTSAYHTCYLGKSEPKGNA
jgi:hypothetical protein